MFKIIHNMVGCHCTNPITQVVPGQEFHTQIDTDEEWNWMITKLRVKMNGVDITRRCRYGLTIYIPYVTGDVEVIAVAEDQHTGRDWDPKKYPRK